MYFLSIATLLPCCMYVYAWWPNHDTHRCNAERSCDQLGRFSMQESRLRTVAEWGIQNSWHTLCDSD